MQAKTERFKVHEGFWFYEEKKIMNQEDALRELSGEHQRFYGRAIIHKNGRVVLLSESYICPCCGTKIPAFPPFLSKECIYQKIPKNEIETWLNPQLSFADIVSNRILNLKKFCKLPSKQRIFCPKCTLEATCSQNVCEAFIRTFKKRITVGLEIPYQKLFSISWLRENASFHPQLIFQTLTFNLKNGHVFLSLEYANGKSFANYDITNVPKVIEFENPVFLFIKNNGTVRHNLKAFFTKYRTVDFPYLNDELSAERFLLLTRFQNYESSFYDAIPFTLGTNSLHKNFRYVEKNLKKAEFLPKIIENLALPKMKSIRRTLFQNPQLLFYAEELPVLWELFEDPNLFCRVLTSTFLYELLSCLRDFPQTRYFYQMYAEKKGKLKLFVLLQNVRNLNVYATCFTLMREDWQKEEMQKWNREYIKKQCTLLSVSDKNLQPRYMNHPCYRSKKGLLPFKIDGYSFKLLTSAAAYQRACKELSIRLTKYINMDNLIVGIQKEGKYVGAIEVDRNSNIQDVFYKNHMDYSNPKLYNACRKWAQHFGLHREYMF